MSVLNKIKNNRFVRGLHFGWSSTFGCNRSRFGYLAEGLRFTPPIRVLNPKNVFIYSDGGIERCFISALNAKFVVKEHCSIAEGLTVHTGNHARQVGMFVSDFDETNKPSGYDHDVIVEEDVWLGCNVTLLSGVTIGRGSTVAAGAVVSKSIPPYCICGGVPAKVIKFYWTIDQILEHEAKLYSEEKRYSREELENIFNEFNP